MANRTNAGSSSEAPFWISQMLETSEPRNESTSRSSSRAKPKLARLP
jgi:hypothetical protein